MLLIVGDYGAMRDVNMHNDDDDDSPAVWSLDRSSVDDADVLSDS